MFLQHHIFQLKITGKNNEEIRTLTQPRYVVGSRPGMDIHHPDLSAVHAEFRYETREWIVERLDPNAPISFMGSPVYLKKLNHRDCLHLGPVKLTFFHVVPNCVPYGQQDQSTKQVTHYLLEFIEGASEGSIRILHPGEYILGRGSGTGRIDVPDQFVSKQHSRMILADNHVQIEDLGSANGSFIGRKRIWYIESTCPCTLSMGNTKLRIRSVLEPDPIDNPDLEPTAIWD
jgi:Inner membrane component of T3SS, cytoplasmic domain